MLVRFCRTLSTEIGSCARLLTLFDVALVQVLERTVTVMHTTSPLGSVMHPTRRFLPSPLSPLCPLDGLARPQSRRCAED